jgi:hypothetical protein
MVRTGSAIWQRWAVVSGVALGLVVGATACKKDDGGAGGKSGESSGATASGDDLSLLPADSEVVIGVNIKQMQSSALWKSMVEPRLMKGEAQKKISEFKTKCGFDPITSISSVAVGMKNMADDGADAVAVVRGLDKAKMLDCIDKHKDEFAKDSGGTMTRDGDTILMTDAKGKTTAFGFINDTTAVGVLGANASAAGIKAVASGGSSLKSSAPFLEMYKKVKTGDSLWMLASGKVLDKAPIKASAAYGSLNMTDGLTLDVRVRFESPDAATQAAAMVNGQAKQATAYVDKAEFTSEGNELHGSVVISGQKLSELAPMLGMLMGGMGGGQ